MGDSKEAQFLEEEFRILLLDSKPSTRGLAKSALERNLPCTVTLCRTVQEVIEQSLDAAPDLYLLDVSPEGGSGEDLARQLKEVKETADVPIVFLSAYKEPTKRVAALKAGGVDYIDKPFYPEELVARLNHHMGTHRLRLEKQRQISEQQALLRVLCHDLVNPIFGAHSLLELKHSMGKLDDRTISIILSSCQSAMDIIEHVRNEHHLVAADKQVEAPVEVAVSEAFEEAARTLQGKFDSKKVSLSIQYDRDALLPISRVVLVHSILNNLLTNALKFSFPKSEVKLRAKASDYFCDLVVEDKGVGMPPEILENVFVEGAKVSRVGTSEEKGTGFGMPLMKRYVEKHGGSVTIESKEKDPTDLSSFSGTTVRLRFPLKS